MKRRLLLPAVLFTLSLPVGAADIPAAVPTAPTAPAPTAPAPDAATTKAADDMWRDMQRLQQPPVQAPASPEEAVRQLVQWVATQKAAADTFVQKFPDDPRGWLARMAAFRAGMRARGYTGEASDPVADQRKLAEIINAPAAPAGVKGEAAFMDIMISGAQLRKGDVASFATFYQKSADYFVKYPDHPLAGELKTLQMQALSEDTSPLATEILKKLAAGPDPRLAEAAKATLERKQKMAEFKTKPIELKFTAVDGQPIDLANLRGKVVLIDFWASWCPPCMAEMPNLVSTYEKFHEKGFEILGISLDQEKDAMESTLKRQNMTWSQCFDGGLEGKVSRFFSVTQIPSVWLFDKKGVLYDTGLFGENLSAAVEKLLAE